MNISFDKIWFPAGQEYFFIWEQGLVINAGGWVLRDVWCEAVSVLVEGEVWH